MRNHEALTELRRVAEAAPEELLHMRMFREVADCGTAYCLLGWASLDLYFQALGLRSAEETSRFSSEVDKMSDILGINELQVARLFASDISVDVDPHAVTKTEVLKNIDRLIKGKQAREYKAMR